MKYLIFMLIPLTSWAINPKERLKELEGQCEKSESRSCCEASLKRLIAHGMVEPTNGKCPNGYEFNMLKCISSLRWCEKIKPLKEPRSS